MEAYQIPTLVETFKEGTVPTDIGSRPITFEPILGELIHVLLWERYPDYDIIYGIPDEASPRYEKEIAFFCVRRNGRPMHGHYFDILESQAMIKGFETIIKHSKTYSPKLWEQHLKI